MSELKPLDVVDNRTIEQIRADGDDRWPDGRPYIKDGVCCVCGANVETGDTSGLIPVHVCLVQVEKPVPCEMHILMQEDQMCTMLAHWASGVEHLTPWCDECIVNCLEHLPDNRNWLAPALADIRERHLKVGARVRIQSAPEMGQLGTVYARNLNGDAWYVHPDRRGPDVPGILCLPDELDVCL